MRMCVDRACPLRTLLTLARQQPLWLILASRELVGFPLHGQATSYSY